MNLAEYLDTDRGWAAYERLIAKYMRGADLSWKRLGPPTGELLNALTEPVA